MIFFFSGLGNSRHIAEKIAEEGERLFFIPEVAKNNLYDYKLLEGERLGFVFPVYCWQEPKLVADFVKRLRLDAKPGYTFMVCTCGDDCGYTERTFRRTLGKIGLELDAAMAVQMPNTYVNLPGMDVDPIELSDKKLADAEGRIAEVRTILQKRERVSQMIITGMPWLKTYVVKPLFYATLVNDKRFRVNGGCVGCGICAENCPLENIKMEGGRPEWQGNCTTCMSCYHRCPQRAIQFGKATEKKGQYYYNEMKNR